MTDKQTVKFGDICREVKLTTKDPIADGYERYIGLEHLDSGSLKIKRWGMIAEDNPSFTRVFKKGHILFGKRRPYLKKAAIAEFDGICSGDIIVMEPKNDPIYQSLLAYIVQTESFWSFAVKSSSGSLSPRTKFKLLAGITIKAIDSTASKKYLNVLTKTHKTANQLDELILSNQYLIKRMSIAAYRKEETLSARLSIKSWQKLRLKDLVSINYGKSPKGIEDEAGKYQIVGTGGITGKTNSYIVDKETLIIGRKGTIDRPQYLNDKCWPIDTTFYCVPKVKVSMKWLFYVVSAINLRGLNEASGVPSLSRSALENIQIYTPDYDSQVSIAGVLDSITNTLISLKEEENSLRKIIALTMSHIVDI